MRTSLMLFAMLRRSSTFAPSRTRRLTRRAAKEPADDAVVAAGAAQRRERLDSELAALGFDAEQLEGDAGEEQVNRAFRKQSLYCHPDKSTHADAPRAN